MNQSFGFPFLDSCPSNLRRNYIAFDLDCLGILFLDNRPLTW